MPQLKQQMLGVRKRLSMHPDKDLLLLNDGHSVCFSFELHFADFDLASHLFS